MDSHPERELVRRQARRGGVSGDGDSSEGHPEREEATGNHASHFTHLVYASPACRYRTGALVHEYGAGDTPPAGDALLQRDGAVVSDNDDPNVAAELSVGLLGGQGEVQDVTGVVLDHKQRRGLLFRRHAEDRRQYLPHVRAGEASATDGPAKHPRGYVADVTGLVAGPPAAYQRYTADIGKNDAVWVRSDLAALFGCFLR